MIDPMTYVQLTNSGLIAMTDNTERDQLMKELLNKELSEWSAQELDGFIVDAHLSLEASLRGRLRTANGMLVEPDMGEWGDIHEEDDAPDSLVGVAERTCVACLAGAFFVSKTGTLIPEDDHPSPYNSGDRSMGVLRFMDGLRYLEEDSEDGESIAALLKTMGYEVYPPKEGEYSSHIYEEQVAPALKRFIELNPRLKTKLVEVLAVRASTTQDHTCDALEKARGLVTVNSRRRAMTGQLMQELSGKDISQWLPVEIDGFIVDAYLSLLKSMRDNLYTSDGLLVKPNMNIWGEEIDDEDGVLTTCVACLAGAFFVSKTGILIPKPPFPFEAGYTTMNVLKFLDGLRYLEVGDEDGTAIGQLLRSMGYQVAPARDYGECTTHLEGQQVASKLERLIELNPRLTDRLRTTTTTTKRESYGS